MIAILVTLSSLASPMVGATDPPPCQARADPDPPDPWHARAGAI